MEENKNGYETNGTNSPESSFENSGSGNTENQNTAANTSADSASVESTNTVSDGNAESASATQSNAENASAENVSATNECTADAAQNPPCTVEKSEEKESVPTSVEDTPTSLYRWDYSTERKEAIKSENKKKNKGIIIYSCVITLAFVLAFTALAILLITRDDGRIVGDNVELKEGDRVVYVREYDKESGILTPQEIYSKCRPSTVSVVAGNASGSGFIISSDGYIVTAGHMIQDKNTPVTVILSNKQIYPAKIVDYNAFVDIAVLKIEEKNLSPVTVGKSSDLLVGDSLIAIGSPAAIELEGTLTMGKVSYLNRKIPLQDTEKNVVKYMNLIQTDTALNHGNSGGPVMNEKGEVIGFVIAGLDSAVGINFVSPIDQIMPIVNAMINGESYSHLLYTISNYPAKMGITVYDAESESTFGKGVCIDSVDAGSDAAKYLAKNDIIVKVDGINITSKAWLGYVLGSYNPGDKIAVTVYRSGQYLTFNVTLGK